jgi:hypothetical protein
MVGEKRERGKERGGAGWNEWDDTFFCWYLDVMCISLAMKNEVVQS